MSEVATIVDHALVLRRLAAELPRYRFRFHDEKSFQDGIARVLDTVGLPYIREFPAPPIPPAPERKGARRSTLQAALEVMLVEQESKARFDFWLDAGVVIEAKIKGSFSMAAAQAARYCRIETVRAVAIVTNKLWGTKIPPQNGKPVEVVMVERVTF